MLTWRLGARAKSDTGPKKLVSRLFPPKVKKLHA